MIVETGHPVAGRMRGLGLPIHFSDGREQSPLPVALFVQHTVEVLHEYGFSNARIRALKEEGAVIAKEAMGLNPEPGAKSGCA